MVLGDGIFQKGLIRHLLSQGMVVHAVSRKRSGIISGDFVHHELDYCDHEAVSDLFERLRCDVILSAGSEAALPTIARVNETYGLAGPDRATVELFRDKLNYKGILASKGLSVPELFAFNPLFDSSMFPERKHGTRLILKQRIGSGSAGLKVCNGQEDIPADVLTSDGYFAEAYIDGVEYGGDLLVSEGELRFYWPTLKRNNQHHVPYMHLLLADAEPVRELLTVYLQTVIRTLSLPAGIYNVDIIVSNGRPYLIDMGPRIGGNAIPDILYLGMDVNEWQLLMDLATGSAPHPVPKSPLAPHGVYILNAAQEGVLREWTPPSEDADALVEVFYSRRPGDRILPFTQGGHNMGYVIFKASTDDALLVLADRIESHRWFRMI